MFILRLQNKVMKFVKLKKIYLSQFKPFWKHFFAYLLKKSHRSYSKPGKKIVIQYSNPENPIELFQKLLEDLKELAEYKESLENSSKEISISSSNPEKEEPPQDFDIRKLIKEKCCVKVCEEQKQNMKDTMLELEVKNIIEQPVECGNRTIKSLQNFRVIRKSSISLNTSQISSIHEITPILSTKEPEHLLSMGYEHLSITPETESNEVTESNAKNLLPILSEYEVTLEDKKECDVPVSTIDVCDDHFEILSDSKNDDDILVYDDFEDIEYVEASLPDPEIVSVEEEKVVYHEEEEVDLEDISQIQDVVLREKLLSITSLISNIKSLNDNPIPDCVLNSFVSIPIFEESYNSLSDNFSPEFETFCDHTEETRSGNTTHANNSLPEYDSFCFEIKPNQERLIYVLKNNIPDDSNDPLLEEADLFLASDNSIPPGIKNFVDNSEGDIHFLEELLIDDSILSHESSDSNFENNPSIPRPPPKPPDAKTDVGEESPVVMNDKDKFDKDYNFFMFAKERIVLNLPKSAKNRTISTQDQKSAEKAGSASSFLKNNHTLKLNYQRSKV
nr:hypothetical protein [Tanacetum cinerariifolium]